MLGGYLAIAWSMTGYEVFHAVEHFPYEWWKSATEHPYMGLLFRKLYGFHHFHHANIKSNEAISGFYGLPIADWVFRTYHQPKELLLEGRVATAKEFQMKPPIRIVRWLDNLAREQEAKIIRKVA
jgi:hemolysin III